MHPGDSMSPAQLTLLNKFVKLCAKGFSKRSIEVKLHTDRSTRKFFFDFGYKVTFVYADKVAKDVVKNSMGYKDVFRAYGKRGLTALWNYNILLEKHKYFVRAKTVKRLRDTTNTSFSTIGEQLGMCTWSANMSYRKLNNHLPNRNVQRVAAAVLAEKMYRLYCEGKTVLEISTIVQRSPRWIRGVLKDIYNIRVAVKNRKYDITANDLEKIHSLREKLTWKELSYIYKIPMGSLQAAYYSYAVQRRLKYAKVNR